MLSGDAYQYDPDRIRQFEATDLFSRFIARTLILSVLFKSFYIITSITGCIALIHANGNVSLPVRPLKNPDTIRNFVQSCRRFTTNKAIRIGAKYVSTIVGIYVC